jgi:hypothetical protein
MALGIFDYPLNSPPGRYPLEKPRLVNDFLELVKAECTLDRLVPVEHSKLSSTNDECTTGKGLEQ